MKNFLLILGLTLILCGCKNDVISTSEAGYVFYDEDEDCRCVLDVEPDSYELTIKLSIDSKNKKVPLTIYNGNMENGFVVYSDTAKTATVKIDLPLNRNYTAVAKYLNDKDTIVVPVYFKYDKSSYECANQPCWKVKNNVVSLKLKD